MKKMIPAMVFVAALWVWMLMGIPHYSDIMLVGSIMFVILLPWVFWLLWRKGKRQNRIEPVSAEIFEDPRRRKINRMLHRTTFSLELNDGSRECRTVRDGSAKYREYMALRKQ